MEWNGMECLLFKIKLHLRRRSAFHKEHVLNRMTSLSFIKIIVNN